MIRLPPIHSTGPAFGSVIIMKTRPKCIIAGCNNLAAQHNRRKDGSFSYRKRCRSHSDKHGGYYSSGGNVKRKKLGEAFDMDRSKCSLCGWDKAPCDRHRIVFGCDGGKYTLGNTLSVCPNCHRLIHMGLLTIK